MSEPAKAPISSITATNGKAPLGRDGIVQASELVGEDGRTIIHADVVAKMAGYLVRQVEGVHALVPLGSGQALSRFARRVFGKTMQDLGVHVEVGAVEAAVDVRIIVEYGASIVEAARDIRRSVIATVESQTGLTVVEVNVEVVDLYFPGGEERTETRVR